MRSGGDRIQATEGKIIERPRNQPRQQKEEGPPCFRTGETIDIENNQEASSCFLSKVFTTKKIRGKRVAERKPATGGI